MGCRLWGRTELDTTEVTQQYCVYILIYSPIDRNLGCLHILTIMSNVAMKIRAHASFQNSVLFSLGKNIRSKTAGSYARFIFNPYKRPQNVFHSGCTNLHSQQQCKEFPFLHILTKTYFCYLLNDLDRCRSYLVVVMICISLMISDTEHIFTWY